MAQVRLTPSGVMDKDTEVSYIGKGNYIDALNIRHRAVDSNGGDFGGVVPVKGNANLVNTINGVAGTAFTYAAETQTYRVFVDVEDIYNGSISSHDATIYIEDSTGVLHTKTTGPFVSYPSANLASAITVIKADLDNILNLWLGVLFTYSATTVTKTISGTNVAGYFDVTTTFTNEFSFLITNSQGEYAKFSQISEYHTEAGKFTFIGSAQLDDEMFVLLAGDDLNSDGTSVISEIGVIYPNATGYSYTKLLRSKKLRFNPQRKAEMQIERVGPQINIYWADNLNPPRVIYLKYSNRKTINGALNITEGRYDLANVDFETLFFLPNETAYFENINIVEGKGKIKAGTKRYTGRFLTEDFVYQDFVEITNPFPIYLGTKDKAYEIFGNETDTITNKAISLTIKNFTPGIYKYFELVVIEYKGTSFTANIVQRFTLSGNETELNVEHTEIGQDLIQLSNEELLAVTSKYVSVKNIIQHDNRMVLSNLKEQIDYNLNEWSTQIEHSIEETFISGTGYLLDDDSSDPNINYGEYAVPENVRDFTGYMINDTYRFGIQVQWKNTGRWSNAYWVDDIRFDGTNTNVNTSDNRRRIFGGSVTSVNTTTETITVNNHKFYEGQRIIFSGTTPPGGLFFNIIYYAINVTTNTFQVAQDPSPTTPLNLTSSGTAVTVTKKKIDNNFAEGISITENKVKVFYPKFHNIDLEYLVDTNGDGIGDVPIKKLIKAFKIVKAERIPEVLATGLFGATGYFVDGSKTYYIPLYSTNEVPYQTSWTLTAPPFTTITSNRSVLNFISSDLYFGKEYEYKESDSIKILGCYSNLNTKYFSGVSNAINTGITAGDTNKYFNLDGYFVDPLVYDLQYTNYTIKDSKFVDYGSEVNFQGKTITTKTFNTSYDAFGGPLSIFAPRLFASHFFELDSAISAPHASMSSSDRGLYYGQIFRDLGGNLKYPKNKELTTYHSIGNFQLVNSTDNGKIDSLSVFGGDVFIQRTHLRTLFQKWDSAKSTLGYGLSFYSQNERNSQLFTVLEHDLTFSGPGYVFPQKTDKTQIGTSATVSSGEWKAGLFYWLEQWPEVSNQNEYSQTYSAVYQASDVSSFDENNDFDGSSPIRITWSSKKTTGSLKDNYRLFKPLDFADLDFTRGEISHHEVVNNAFYTFQERSVQRQYFRDASLVGAQEGTDIVVGSGSILGAPGVELTSIGTSKKESVVRGKNPNGKDIVYWYNDRLQKLVRLAGDGISVLSDRGLATFFLNNGKYISNEFYPLSGRGVHGIWDDKYGEAIFTFKYNDGVSDKSFTIVYDEIKNGFTSFHSYTPNIYLPYNNTFFSPDPEAGFENTIYLHDSGLNYTFYGVTGDYEPYIEFVMNYDSNLPKIFEAIQVNSERIPFASANKPIYFNTKNHTSYLDNADLELREDLFYSTIKNDSTGTGVNSNDTSRLFGRWLKMKIFLASSAGTQKLINAIVKFRASPRLYNQ
jgi:hypothetical protein